MGNRIFICYRREDSRGWAGRLYDQLAAHFGHDQIFMDVDAIQPGLDFVDAIESAISETDALIVIIGPNWLDATDTIGNRRLDNPEDFIRLEVTAALVRNIRVIPVLVERATMPRSTDLPDSMRLLARRHAIEIRHTRFQSDVQSLIHALELAIEQVEVDRKAEAKRIVVEKEEAKRLEEETAKSEHIETEKAKTTDYPVYQPDTPHQVRETKSIMPKSSANPLLAALLSSLLFGGVGQIYLGQRKKGLVLIAGTLIGSFFFGLGAIIGFLGTEDAYSIAQKLRKGEAVREWEFAWTARGFGFALLLFAVEVGLATFLGVVIIGVLYFITCC
jgi:hypothetical protein